MGVSGFRIDAAKHQDAGRVVIGIPFLDIFWDGAKILWYNSMVYKCAWSANIFFLFLYI